jgi:hypothetical protein
MASIRVVDLRLTIDGDHEDAATLSRWLSDERALRGHLRRSATAPRGAMGTTTDLLVQVAAASASGVLTALTQSLVTFVAQRRRSVTIEVKTARGAICKIKVDRSADAPALAAELAGIASNAEPSPRQ